LQVGAEGLSTSTAEDLEGQVKSEADQLAVMTKQHEKLQRSLEVQTEAQTDMARAVAGLHDAVHSSPSSPSSSSPPPPGA